MSLFLLRCSVNLQFCASLQYGSENSILFSFSKNPDDFHNLTNLIVLAALDIF